ncbi:hypothetical protein FIV00_29305 [Labrenzia sp. THAF82]|nr:hypothetical protein FIV00_29305 [Labrenzia sp. THAF82]
MDEAVATRSLKASLEDQELSQSASEALSAG